MIIRVSSQARRDISDAYDYIAADSPRAAEHLLERLDAVVDRLAAGELSGPQVRLRRGSLANRWPVPPFVIYYRRTRRTLLIIRVYHAARRSIEKC